MQINGVLFKQVMSCFATGVTVVTVQYEGKKHGNRHGDGPRSPLLRLGLQLD